MKSRIKTFLAMLCGLASSLLVIALSLSYLPHPTLQNSPWSGLFFMLALGILPMLIFVVGVSMGKLVSRQLWIGLAFARAARRAWRRSRCLNFSCGSALRNALGISVGSAFDSV